jgi:hypothetical protein
VRDEAYSSPGVWVRVNTYRITSSAVTIARLITGDSTSKDTPPYAPVGSFVTETRMTEFETEVWVMYTSKKEET